MMAIYIDREFQNGYWDICEYGKDYDYLYDNWGCSDRYGQYAEIWHETEENDIDYVRWLMDIRNWYLLRYGKGIYDPYIVKEYLKNLENNEKIYLDEIGKNDEWLMHLLIP